VGNFSLRELYALAHTVYRNTALHGEKKEVSDPVRAETGSEMCLTASEECPTRQGRESAFVVLWTETKEVEDDWERTGVGG